ncbi:DUF5916 domain-containing protein [Paludibacter sp.]|uniref:DUF5916 domain-containing protein n=1 Tax=Paludibacter sp. TaxID=1898105 RepID=UPI0013523EB1|nr:DUF5916 domain-containing protein [Paludibacter sp.]MTK52272.1 carbohydrate binding family 9 domain-containing protein [Paludibacter sp.]
MRKLALIFFIITVPVWSITLPLRKQFTITRTPTAPKIDALPTDKVWKQASPITDFIQQSPINGGTPSQKTEVKMLYDDRAIYVLALLYDSKPDSIFSELGDRDSGDEANADLFSVEINPYNNGLNSMEFMVSAAGVQMDSKNDIDQMHKSWDAVWKSAVQKTKEGWIAEMEIPFSAIRFPKKEIQLWEINFFRLIKRNGEAITWNFVDKNRYGWLNQAGEMHGIEHIKPPLRLSLMPYLTTYYDSKISFKGGMDLKYGLNESFTLDMMLIPDFGQTRGDDGVLNLTSVETKYDEKRQFFTEGTELFSKGDLFYSRRIGGQPRLYENVASQLSTHEIILKNPGETSLYNATKISGYTSSGWGIGILNAITQPENALIKDTLTNTIRRYITQDVSNYNLLVVEKNLGKESYVSWVNTNVTIPGEHHMANVSGLDFKYKFLRYLLSGDAFFSYIHDKTDTGFSNQTGHRLNLNFAKTKGEFRYELDNSLLSHSYDPRDFGYLENKNLISNNLKLQYFHFTPTRHFNEISGEMNFTYESLYLPLLYSRFELAANLKLLFKSLHYIKFYLSATPIPKYDYFEPRVEGWKYKEPTAGYGAIEYQTDTRKQLALMAKIGYWQATRFGKKALYLTWQPHYRVNDKLSFDFMANWYFLHNAIGFVDKNIRNDSIYFGRRNVTGIENIGTIKFSFSNKNSLNLRFRHYWSNIKYGGYYLLQTSGNMQDVTLRNNYNINYNLFNADVSYVWQFLPGSELSFVWKNYFSTANQKTNRNYLSNLTNVFSSSQLRSLSLKIIYYIDYQTIKAHFKKA